ncbi:MULTISPECIES: S49 family peptidase [unclassified Pseudoalteromonas]|uniref:S49 family peptidase n=1 Tax=unclassified Pseudoalteromonas TaxID=194690 RepID=UPI0015FA4274|nr:MULTISPECIES: S49 family peptidase [unclassified Pseudoalteromonas]MBB1291035.1 S49 family peptidase [Pseudoalteromonas sp. SR41-5]MBB1415339.1 S49 family peptidase [Pseudoalteromonas sp. SG43-8]
MPNINYPRIAEMAFNTPLLCTAHLSNIIESFIAPRLLGHINAQSNNAVLSDAQISAKESMPIPLGDPEKGDRIVVLPVHGILIPRRGSITDSCEEVMSYELLRTQMQKALNDDSVLEIVLDINSGGGTAQAAFECAEFIYQARSIKPIRAIINFNAYSGAYLIAAACTEIIISDTAGVGSVGVYQKRLDMTKAYADAGYKMHTFHRGATKVYFHPDVEMSEEERAHTEKNIEKTYQKFVGAIVKYRDMSLEQVLATEADTYEGQAAIDLKLADRLATPQDAINQIAQGAVQRSSAPTIARSIKAQAAAIALTQNI